MKKKLTTQEFIDKSNLIHNNKYSYVKSNYIGSISKLIITCSIHGDFTQLPSNHLKGHGCNDCGLIATINSKPINNNTFLHSDLKICKYCNLPKIKDDFSKDKNSIDGFQTICKPCTQEYKKKYYLENKEFVKKQVKQYSENNAEKLKKSKKEYYNKNKKILNQKNKKYNIENKDNLKFIRKKWTENNREKINLNEKNRRLSNPLYALKVNMRNNILKSFRERHFEKPGKTTQILGCTFEELKTHLESQFESWMNWANRGLYNGELNHGWDIDHIIPLSSAKTKEELLKLNHYTNLQPMCSYKNRYIKRNIF